MIGSGSARYFDECLLLKKIEVQGEAIYSSTCAVTVAEGSNTCHVSCSGVSPSSRQHRRSQPSLLYNQASWTSQGTIYLYYSLDFGKILIPPVPTRLSAFIPKVKLHLLCLELEITRLQVLYMQKG
jgi:hypothetical protein